MECTLDGVVESWQVPQTDVRHEQRIRDSGRTQKETEERTRSSVSQTADRPRLMEKDSNGCCNGVSNNLPKSHEILMFVCLQKGVKQCCDGMKFHCTHCSGRPEQ